MDVNKIFENIGGLGAVSTALDVKYSAASEMKRRGSIPVKYWPKLLRACRAKKFDLTLEQLVRIHSSEKAA